MPTWLYTVPIAALTAAVSYLLIALARRWLRTDSCGGFHPHAALRDVHGATRVICLSANDRNHIMRAFIAWRRNTGAVDVWPTPEQAARRAA